MNKKYELDEIIVTSDLPELETEALCEHVEIRVFAKSDYGELDFPQLSEEVWTIYMQLNNQEWMNTMGNVSELLQKSKMGTMLEVYETLCDEGVDDDLAVDMINRELYANPGDYNNPEDMYKATHKQFGYEARLNQVINSIREMIRGDVVQVVQTGHKEQILALREDLLSYVDTIDSFEEDV